MPLRDHARSAFTLIELLVVIAIIAILAVVVVLTLNPAELLRQTRDANRVSDAATLRSAISIYAEDTGGSLGSSSVIYASIPDPIATSTAGDQCQGISFPSAGSDTYQCASSPSYRNINGTGWIPINFTSISSGAPIGSLPVDPINTSSTGEYYTFTTNGTTYETTMALESKKYAAIEASDGGIYTDLYEQGTSLTLAPIDFYSAGFPIRLRGTAMTSGSGPTLTLSLPSGTSAGDLAIIFVGAEDNSISLSTSGWTTLNQAGGLYVVGWTFSKILTTSDITAGSVTITLMSRDDAVFTLDTFVGATWGIRETDVQEYGGSFTSPVSGPSTTIAVTNTDAGLYFAFNHSASTDAIDHGLMQDAANDGVGASGVLNFQSISSSGSFTPTFTYSSPGTGYYQSLVIVKHN